jgi:hypothetical protein
MVSYQPSARGVVMHDFAFFSDHVAEMEVSNGASGTKARTRSDGDDGRQTYQKRRSSQS